MSDAFTPEQVGEAFLLGTPNVNQQIKNLSLQYPSWLEGQYQAVPWDATENSKVELSYRGSLPQQETDFDRWRKVPSNEGCNPCETDHCGYNWTTLGGFALERKVVTLMDRDFRTPDFCVRDISSTEQFKTIFEQMIMNLYSQLKFFKEVNIGLNFMNLITKKCMVDSQGFKFNTMNPYVYRNIGAARLSTLNMRMLEVLYGMLRNRPDVIPYDVVDGRPLYALECSDELISHLYRDDPGLRWDARFSDKANEMLGKYNFMSLIRDMYIPAPIEFPKRFVIVAGEPVEVLPFINNVKAEAGSFTDINPLWYTATHEAVNIHGMYPFKVYYRKPVQSLGGGSDFGPEDGFMDKLTWVNIATPSDPGRRSGYYWTHATIGLSAQYSGGCISILVERPSQRLLFTQGPDPVCPTTPVECDNAVPDVACPCPVVLGMVPNPMIANTYFITLASATSGRPGYTVYFELDSGLVVTGTLVAISTDGKTIEVTFAADSGIDDCSHIRSIYCRNIAYPVPPACACSSIVEGADDCRSNQTGAVELLLQQCIRAEVGEDILAYFGDCTTAMLEITAIDAENLTYTVQYAEGYGPTDDPAGEGETVLSADMICDRGGISKVCVPPATDSTCPACTSTSSPCVYEVAPQ